MEGFTMGNNTKTSALTSEMQLIEDAVKSNWPERYARARTSNSRRNLRKSYIANMEYAKLQKAGASCLTCKYREKAPHMSRHKWACELGEESGGVYQPVKVTDLCTLFSQQESKL
jgi:hypothetical protein